MRGPTARRRRSAGLRLIALAEAGKFESVHPALWETAVHPDRRGDAALEQVVREMMLEVGPEAFIRQQRAIIGRMDSRPFLKSIQVPTVVAVGEQDVLMPLPLAEEMHAEIAGAELAVIPNAGHLSTLEQPEAVTAVLATWLAQAGDEP